MIRVLFVDDDPFILAALKRVLRRYEDVWSIEFASSGAQALQRLDEQQFEAIVSDMHMPEMDGAQLLQQVQRRHPRMLRLVLSGQASDEAKLRVIGPAHQFLSKPCDPVELNEAIARAFMMRDRLADQAIQAIVSRVSVLPAVPAVFAELVDQLCSPTSCLDQVGEIVARDVATTAKILQLINSSFFGLRESISSASQAVCLLGIEFVRSLVLTVSLASTYKNAAIPGFSIDGLMRHSVEVGRLAQQLAGKFGAEKALADEALAAGMLHDVGKLILASELPTDYATALRMAQDLGVPSWVVEREQLGASHADLGAYLLSLWGLPVTLVEAVACHHEPASVTATRFSTLTAVHLANALVQAEAGRVDGSYVDRLGIGTQVEQLQRDWRVPGNGIRIEDHLAASVNPTSIATGPHEDWNGIVRGVVSVGKLTE